MTRATHQSRRGNAMVVGLMMGTLLGYSALAVDIGMLHVADTQLQVALDASTLSGASEFDGATSGITKAKARAREISELNPVLSTTLDVPVAEFEVGTLEPFSVDCYLYGSQPVTAMPPGRYDAVVTLLYNGVVEDDPRPGYGDAAVAVSFDVAAGYDTPVHVDFVVAAGGAARDGAAPDRATKSPLGPPAPPASF